MKARPLGKFHHLIGFVIPLLLPVLVAAQNLPRGKIYVASQGSDTVSVIDSSRLEVIATVEVEDTPHNVNHTPDGRLVLVTNKNINTKKPASLSIIRTDTDKIVATVENLGERIEHVVVPSGGHRAYVSEDLAKNAVVDIDLNSNQLKGSIPVGIKPHGLVSSWDGKSLFVPNQLSGTISKIDLNTQKVVAEAEVGRTPTVIAVTPDDKTLYVTLFGERGVAVVDAQKIESGKMQINDVIRVGERPAQVAITPNGRYVLVPAEGPGALYMIEEATHRAVTEIPTGAKAHGVDVSSDSRYAFVTNWNDGSLSVVNLSQKKVLKQIQVGESPAGVDFVPIPD
ncbi:hypothetical protein [Nitrosococcus wardiae]|uniref:YNCE-like beta-propeller domain-containing protein n=1 Tax=Nitrosococcus wardiae TaxID=1814290 RepID=A0A4V1AW23_9GAMM|nr:hypothetical protein [Nitrosococcus wardiae]QBQ55135.1 hypothetical protein E3U44_11915 [Nitrosococcus wardiae]